MYLLILLTGDPMYQPLCNYVTLRPFLDVHHVPEFYNLFFSDDISVSNRAAWCPLVRCCAVVACEG